MAHLVIRNNEKYSEPDVIINGKNICDMPGILGISLGISILPGERPSLKLEIEADTDIDIDALFEVEKNADIPNA